ncbi:MAG TPA: hypothetical protein VF766_08465 [Pyrinomonadaceae bacterium]
MNNRILGFIGSGLLILGIFLPIITVMGILSFSLFTFIQGSLPGPDPTGLVSLFRIIGIVILLLGIGSLILTLKNQFKLLIATGVAALCLLVLIFIKLRALFSDVPEEARDMAGAMAGIGWGLYAMILGAIALIVAGVMKNPATIVNTGYGAPPPPYPPVH